MPGWKKSISTVSDISLKRGTLEMGGGSSDSLNDDPDWRDWPNLIRCCLVEFVGLIIFVFIGSLSFQAGAQSLIVPSLAHGLTIALLIMGFGHISGGHFNPAVTTGIFISQNIHIVHAVCYIIAQLAGGFVGGCFVRGALRYTPYLTINGGTTNMNTISSNEGMALVTEGIITYVLVNSVLMTAVDTGSNVLAPLAIGLSVAVGILAGGPNSGGSMNPARSFGAAASYAAFGENCTSTMTAGSVTCLPPSTVWRYHYVHWVGPLVGAAIAGLLYKLFFAKSSKRWLFK